MIHTFKLSVENQPAVIERILRVTRHRGFSIQTLNVETSDEQLEIILSVAGSRPAHTLFNQLEKLFDVKMIEQI